MDSGYILFEPSSFNYAIRLSACTNNAITKCQSSVIPVIMLLDVKLKKLHL